MIGDIVSTFLALLETTRREGRLIIWPCLALAGEDPQIEKKLFSSPHFLLSTSLQIIFPKKRIRKGSLMDDLVCALICGRVIFLQSKSTQVRLQYTGRAPPRAARHLVHSRPGDQWLSCEVIHMDRPLYWDRVVGILF